MLIKPSSAVDWVTSCGWAASSPLPRSLPDILRDPKVANSDNTEHGKQSPIRMSQLLTPLSTDEAPLMLCLDTDMSLYPWLTKQGQNLLPAFSRAMTA